MIQILENDDIHFMRRTRPVRYSFSLEKSMYQTISEEMMNMFAGTAQSMGYADLMAHPVDKYRQSYKRMDKLRQTFFEKVGNIPDLDKYLAPKHCVTS